MAALRLLLDTVGLICASSEPERFSPTVSAALADGSNVVFVSAASAWEISTKVRIGKLAQATPFVDDWRSIIDALGFVDFDVTSEHAIRSGSYDVDHRDPFDRLICAQAELAGFTVVTNDPKFALFPVTTIW